MFPVGNKSFWDLSKFFLLYSRLARLFFHCWKKEHDIWKNSKLWLKVMLGSQQKKIKASQNTPFSHIYFPIFYFMTFYMHQLRYIYFGSIAHTKEITWFVWNFGFVFFVAVFINVFVWEHCPRGASSEKSKEMSVYCRLKRFSFLLYLFAIAWNRNISTNEKQFVKTIDHCCTKTSWLFNFCDCFMYCIILCCLIFFMLLYFGIPSQTFVVWHLP